MPPMHQLLLGASDAIKYFHPNDPDRRRYLKEIFPYLSDEDVEHWANFYGL